MNHIKIEFTNERIVPSKLPNGYVPVDIDVTPFDNSKTRKEGVSRTYKGYDDGEGNWIEETDDKNMPIFANYVVNRIVLDVPVREPKEQFEKLDAFDKAIESTIDFRNNNMRYEDRSLKVVKKQCWQC